MSGSLLPNQTSANQGTNFFAGLPSRPIVIPPIAGGWLNPEVPSNGEFFVNESETNADLNRYPAGWYYIGMYNLLESSSTDIILNWGFKLTRGDLSQGGEGDIITSPTYQDNTFITSTTANVPLTITQLMYAPEPFNNIFGMGYTGNSVPAFNAVIATTGFFFVLPLQVTTPITYTGV